MKKSTVAAVVVTAAVGLGYGATQFANADDPTPGASPTVAASAGGMPHDPGSRGKGMKVGHLKDLKGVGDLASGELATKLNVDKDVLRDAVRKVARDQFPDAADRDALKDMTAEERATELEKRQDAFVKALAKELNVSEDAITKAVEELKADHATSASARLKERLDGAVKDGTLTQAEADAVTKAVEKGVIGGR